MAPHFSQLLFAQAAFFLTLLQCVNGHDYHSPDKQLNVVHEWTFFDYTWPNEKAREEAMRRGEYVPKNITCIDVTVHKGRIFVTTPRYKDGVPATLSIISDEEECGERLLKPFPNWESNHLGNCKGITSVFVTQIDQFGRLWALDTGVVDTYGKIPTRVCPPKLVVYDLNDKDKIVGTYPLTDNVLDCGSFVAVLVLDIRNNKKDDVVVYMTDVYSNKLIVFDLKHKSFHRIVHQTFLMDPHQVDYIVAGTRVYWALGLLSLSLGPVCRGDRRVYYHPLASVEECFAMASTLQDKAYLKNERANPDSFYCYSKKRDSPASVEIMTEDGIVLFSQVKNATVNCWNPELDPNMEDTAVVARSETPVIATLKVLGREVYGLSTNLQLFFANALTEKQINFRLVYADIDHLVKGTPCEVKRCSRRKSDHRYRYSSHHEP